MGEIRPKKCGRSGANQGSTWQRRSVTCEERPSEQLLVSEILDPRTKDLIGQARISEYVMSNAIVSAVLAMVAENRSVNAVLQELLKADGNGAP